MFAIPVIQDLPLLIIVVKMAVSYFLLWFSSSLCAYAGIRSVTGQWEGSGRSQESSFFFVGPSPFWTSEFDAVVVTTWTAARGLEGEIGIWGVGLLFLFSLEVFVLECFLDRYHSAADIIQLGSLISWLMWHYQKTQLSRAWTKKKVYFLCLRFEQRG